jgi:hypothetical protein
VSLPEWWLAVGWQRTVVGDYWLAWVLGLVWWLVPKTARLGRVREWRRAVGSAVWYAPVLVWMLGAVLHALGSTQVDLAGSASRVPFMLMYAASSAVAGLGVLLLCVAAAVLAGARGPTPGQRGWGVFLVASAWVCVAVVWVTVVVRELAVIEAR